MKFSQRNFENTLIFGLVGACMFHPASSAAGILILVLSQVAERYFTRNVSDSDRDQIAKIRTEVSKHSEFINKDAITKAFARSQ